MPSPFPRPATALACAAAMAAVLPAHADTFSFGPVSEPGTFAYDDISHVDPFEDVFTFSVAAGTTLTFSAFVETPMSNRFWIGDLDGWLDHDGSTVVEGDAETIEQPFPRREVTFADTTLGAGDYTLHLTGTPSAAFPGPVSSYDAVFRFAAVAAPVPEPGTLGLMGMGLLAVAAAGRRGRRD